MDEYIHPALTITSFEEMWQMLIKTARQTLVDLVDGRGRRLHEFSIKYGFDKKRDRRAVEENRETNKFIKKFIKEHPEEKKDYSKPYQYGRFQKTTKSI